MSISKMTWDMVYRAAAAQFRKDKRVPVPDEELLNWWVTADQIHKHTKKQYEDDAIEVLRAALQIEGFEIL